MTITFRIVLVKPPAGIGFGLQKGSGSNYETIQVQRYNANDLTFEFTAELKGEREKLSLPDFKGPFVQGTLEYRFVYIDIGAYAGHAGVWSGRLKVPLTGISWGIIDQLNADTELILETHVPGTGKNGKPNCATVKPFDGWKVK